MSTEPRGLTVAELEALPIEAVVLGGDNGAWQRQYGSDDRWGGHDTAIYSSAELVEEYSPVYLMQVVPRVYSKAGLLALPLRSIIRVGEHAFQASANGWFVGVGEPMFADEVLTLAGDEPVHLLWTPPTGEAQR